MASCMVLFTEIGFARVGKRIQHRPEFTLVLHFKSKGGLDQSLRHCKDKKMSITDLQVVGGSGDYTARVELRQNGDYSSRQLLEEIRVYPDIVEAQIAEENEF